MTLVQVVGLLLVLALVPVGGALLFAATVRIALGGEGTPEATESADGRGV